MRAIGISSPERLPGIDVPTFREQGVDAVLVNWRGVVAPPAITAEQKAAMAGALAAMVKTDAWKKACETRGWVDLYQDPAQFSAFLKETGRIGGILKDLGLIG
jgi:putative tricarboxylic transport membrane protein